MVIMLPNQRLLQEMLTAKRLIEDELEQPIKGSIMNDESQSGYKYLKGFEPSSANTAATGKAMDSALADLRDKKGVWWAGLVEFVVTTRMFNSVLQDTPEKDVGIKLGGKLISMLLKDKYPAREPKDTVNELLADATVVIDAILDVMHQQRQQH
jgi:hypothetical protein